MLEKTGDRLEVAFDSKEAKGCLILERGPYGLYVILPGLGNMENEQHVLIDFFYASECGKDVYPSAVAAVHVWPKENPIDDPLAKVIYYRDKETELEIGVTL